MSIDMTVRQKIYVHCVKRPIGFVVALVALAILSPLFPVTMIVLSFADKGTGVFLCLSAKNV